MESYLAEWGRERLDGFFSRFKLAALDRNFKFQLCLPVRLLPSVL
jgi:hypothetical protein